MARLILLWLLLVVPGFAERHEDRFFAQKGASDREMRSDAKKSWAEFLSKRDTLRQAFAEFR